MLPSSVVRASGATSSLRRLLARPASRKSYTSTVFWATFCGAILTVSLSASSFVPCPATIRKGQFTRHASAQGVEDGEESGATSGLVKGERVRLTKKGGWIEIEERKPRRPQTDDMCAGAST